MSDRAVFPKSPPSRSRTARLSLAAAACAALAVAGCSSSSTSTPAASGSTAASSPAASAPAAGTSPSSGGGGNTPAVTTSSSPAVAGPAPCATSGLSIKQGLGQGYAGGVYEVIDFTNTSGATCTLYGYPGVSLVSGSPYTQLGLAAKRTTGTAVKQVTLAPGATANALLQIVDALNYPPATCGPAKATALKVYPPNQTAPVYLSSTATACSKSVAIMNISPVQPGSGGSS